MFIAKIINNPKFFVFCRIQKNISGNLTPEINLYFCTNEK